MTLRLLPVALAALLLLAPSASATPVCTDGYEGGPPASLCGGRVFPEAAIARAYVQYQADPSGFREYQHGLEYLAKKYPRWVSVFKLSDRYGKDAVTAGLDQKRPYDSADTGDGREILVVKITDHQVADAGKRTLLYSLSVHGNERGGLEGGLRTAEDLAVAATNGGQVVDGVDNYESTTGRRPAFHSYEVRDLLAQQAVYLIDFNIDGWTVGDLYAVPPGAYARGNAFGTDLNRQMPTVGRINPARNPLQESEMLYGHKLMHDVAAAGRGGLMDYGADVHGELTSQAYVDVMYPAGQFDSVDHRRLMAIAERTKSVIDATLYEGIIDEIEAGTGGNEAEAAQPAIPTKPAHWATVWDTLGYTDTGFIGDYMATDLGVTGMDYEIFLNHTVPDKLWNVYLQENHINATRGIIKTAMAYAMFQESEFNDSNVRIDPRGRAAYVVNPDTVTDGDENGPGKTPGAGGKGADGKPVQQRSYSATNMQWFRDTSRLMPRPFAPLAAADIARDTTWHDYADTLVLADVPAPDDAKGRSYDRGTYYANIKSFVQRGGNLVLTDRAIHALGELGVVAKDAVKDVGVYQPYVNIRPIEHGLIRGLRGNARQLVEAAILGYEIGNEASPMTIVSTPAWEQAGGQVVGTTGSPDGTTDDGTRVGLGEIKVGEGYIRIVGGALPQPTEKNDHRYGLRDYAPTYTGLYILENAITHDHAALGTKDPPAEKPPVPGRGCLKGKRFTIRVPALKRKQGRLRSVAIRVNGKSVKVRRRGARRYSVIELRRFRGRRVTVEITRRTSKRKQLVTKRVYRIC